MKLTKQQVLQIPDLSKVKTDEQIGKEFNVHPQTIVYWKRRLRKEGFDIPRRMGKIKLDLK